MVVHAEIAEIAEINYYTFNFMYVNVTLISKYNYLNSRAFGANHWI